MTNIIETAKNSFSLWLNTWWEALPFGIAATVVSWCFSTIQQQIDIHTQLGLLSALLLVTILLQLFIFNALMTKINSMMQGQMIRFSQSIASALLRFFPAVVLLLLETIALGTPVVLLVAIAYFIKIPMLSLIVLLMITAIIIVVPVYFTCAFPLLIFEKLSPVEALKKSCALVKNHWWYVGCVVAIISLVYMPFILLIYFLKIHVGLRLLFNIIFIGLPVATTLALWHQLKTP